MLADLRGVLFIVFTESRELKVALIPSSSPPHTPPGSPAAAQPLRRAQLPAPASPAGRVHRLPNGTQKASAYGTAMRTEPPPAGTAVLTVNRALRTLYALTCIFSRWQCHR